MIHVAGAALAAAIPGGVPSVSPLAGPAAALTSWAPTSALATAIPSPGRGVWYLGPIPLRAYSIAILIGIAVAVWMGTRRYVARGGSVDTVMEVAFWAVPFGIVGGRIYHVITTPQNFFGPDGNLVEALYVWHGGLGIWGAIALGALGAWIGMRRRGLRFAPYADAIAPGLLVAQAIGRLGNWFNQELFGAPTTLPWGLQIDAAHLPAGFAAGTLFHPTFLYEMLWNLAAAAVLIWADRRFRLGHGRVFWLYVVLYTTGRTWIEMLRIDFAEKVLGLRLNVWTSIGVWLVALIVFLVLSRKRPGRETDLYLPGRAPLAEGVGAAGEGAAGGGTLTGENAEDPGKGASPGGGEPSEGEASPGGGEPSEGESSGGGEPSEGEASPGGGESAAGSAPSGGGPSPGGGGSVVGSGSAGRAPLGPTAGTGEEPAPEGSDPGADTDGGATETADGGDEVPVADGGDDVGRAPSEDSSNDAEALSPGPEAGPGPGGGRTDVDADDTVEGENRSN